MYRFLISRKTLLLLASIWVVSGALLFVAGWLLGRHESAPTVDSEHLATVLDATAPIRASAASSEPSSTATRRRSSTPWQKTASGVPAQVAGASASGAGASTASTSPPPSSAPPAAGAASSTASQATATAASTSQAGSAVAPPPPSASPSTAPPPSASPSPASGTSEEASAAPSSPSSTADADAQGGFSLQIGAYASEQNAQTQVEKASGDGLAPFIVPVVDAGRTLYTVRVGHYASRDEALQAADRLRSSKDIAAVIRAADPG